MIIKRAPQKTGVLLALLTTFLLCGCGLFSPSAPGLVRKLAGNGAIFAVAWSPDSRLIAAGSQNTTAQIWDATNGQAVATLSGFRGSVVSVAWSPDGRLLATGSTEPTNIIRIWDTTTWQPKFQDDPSKLTAVKDLRWSPDGKLLAAGLAAVQYPPGFDGVVIYDVAAAKVISKTPSYESVKALSWAPDGQNLAFGGSPGVTGFWKFTLNQAAFAQPTILANSETEINSVAWSPDGKSVASASDNGKITVWDFASRAVIQMFSHNDAVKSLAWSPDSKKLAAGWWDIKTDPTVSEWDIASGNQVASFPHSDGVNTVAWSPDGKYLASGTEDGGVWIWQAK